MDKQEILQNVKQYFEERPFPESDEYKVTDWTVTDEDFVTVISAVMDRWITEWVLADEFRHTIANIMQVRYSALVNSGSSANLLAVTVCKDLWGNKKGDKVITCATAFPTTVAPIIQNGLVPLFIDIDPRTLDYNPYVIERELQRDDVVGVILAHNLGLAHDEVKISELCKKYNKWYITDCCDALGAKVDGRSVGSYADMSTLSFFPAHHITTGEGGAVLTSNAKLYRLVQQYGNWGRDCWCSPGQTNTCNKRFEHNWNTGLPVGYDHKYTFTKVGYNMKMTEMQAAMGYSQVKKLPEFVQKRRENYKRLYAIHKKYDLYLKAPVMKDGDSPFGFPMVASSYWTKKEFVEYLENINIRTRPIFSGNILKHPMMQDVEYEVAEDLVGSDMLMERAFFIGVHPSVTDKHIEKYEEALKNYF